ncbi:MAG: peptidylprolyl isomerase [Gammaproteobacteria bacterium]|mgnify:FL=1|jgi:FKBP-type peptidyl-prolyl cis-trans isomerase SlyD|tara:strand:+ start:403 stop:840 length:438 start_codon:yes stop_codon:yes gene_type:complete
MKISNQKLVSMTYSIHEGTNLLENVDTPVSFIYGKETNLLPIVENSLKGKEKGNELTIEVSPELGFGEIDENLIFVDSRDNVPKEYSKIGMQIDFENDKGMKRKFRVTNVDKDKITFDGNHPFSGKTLVYKIKIIDVANTEVVKD